MNTIHKTYWDIETAPISATELSAMEPKFKPAANLKDPEKIAASIAEKKAEWAEKAALSPLTGRILCIGVLDNSGFRIISGDEPDILTSFWHLWDDHTRQFYGFNVASFDIPFLMARSWKHGVKPAIKPFTKPWDLKNSTDLLEYWRCGQRDQVSGGLENLCKFFGLPTKPFDGKDFGKMWEDDRAAAEAYLEGDVSRLRDIAGIMGL